MAAALYSRWFAGWWPSLTSPNADVPEIVACVRAAHAESECFTPGWVARAAVPGGGIVAVRDGEEMSLQSGDYVNLTCLAAPVRAGDASAITTRRDTAEPQDGWWLTWAAAGPAPASHIYASLERWSGSCGFDREGDHTVLADEGLPYTLKCPAEPALFGRGLPGPLSCKRPMEEHEKVCGERTKVLPPIFATLHSPLTMRLGRGVALAEDPATAAVWRNDGLGGGRRRARDSRGAPGR